MAGRRGHQVQRFLTTVLFTDIVGSTELAAELGDRGWRDLVQAHHKLIRTALRRHGGREVDTAGDGFFAVFDAPAAAADCALEIIEEVAPLGLEVRAGLHVGEVEEVVGKVGGISVPIGSRIMAMAAPSEVLVSSTVHDLAAGSGLAFEDRGSHTLKGVPGEWHVFAVTRPADAAPDAEQRPARDGMSESDRAARRAAAVHGLRARPLWRRHPRAVAAVALVVVLVVSAVGLAAWSPWLPAALPGVAENSTGLIDPGRNSIVAEAAVGIQPLAIAIGEGSVWIANSGDNTISQVDPATHSVIDTIDVGQTPTSIAVGAGSVWVADSGERSLTRINAATRRVVDTIEVGNGPGAIALGSNAVWVANTADGTISRVDVSSDAVGQPIRIGSAPTAIAADDSGVWVVSADAGTVSLLDPTNGTALAAPIAVGARPQAIAIGGGAVWVANTADGTISRIDPAGHRVTSVIDVGGTPVGLATTGSTLWVADASGSIERVDLASDPRVVSRIATSAAPTALAATGDGAWFVTGSSRLSHRGGTLRIVSQNADVDPVVGWPELMSLVGDGLVGYRRVGGVAGNQLLPDLATSIPSPSDGGLTYAFQLRPGLVYSDGTPIRASDFRFAIERNFQVADVGSPNFFAGIEGADACAQTPVAHCDLSTGIEADDARGTVTFHLTAPDSNFLYILALPYAQPLPQDAVPADQLITGPYPSTGPYVVTGASQNEIQMSRNPHFQPANSDVRPDGFADQVVWTYGIDPAQELQMVESGDADAMINPIPTDSFAELRTQFTPQLHQTPALTYYLLLNSQVAPFDNLDVRRAVALAVDRAQIAELRGGEFAAEPTCQILPPNFPGYEPYCPFTRDPGVTGQWSAPDLASARQLVASSGTAGMKVVVGPVLTARKPIADYLASMLTDLGYDASVETTDNGGDVFAALPHMQIGFFGWEAEYPSPDAYLGGFACGDQQPFFGTTPASLCSTIDSAIDDARSLQLTDLAAANRKWAEIDRLVTDNVLWAPVTSEGTKFVSARLGNFQFSSAVGFLLDQAWVQ